MERCFMKRNNDEYVREWLMYAYDNLVSAKRLFSNENQEDYVPYHTISFMCQGSAEKYLKAYLIWKGWILEKIHDMEDILTYAIDFNSEFEKLRQECKLLNKYITEGRYPGDLPFESIGEKDAKEAIDAANKIAKFVKDRIKFEEKKATDFTD